MRSSSVAVRQVLLPPPPRPAELLSETAPGLPLLAPLPCAAKDAEELFALPRLADPPDEIDEPEG